MRTNADQPMASPQQRTRASNVKVSIVLAFIAIPFFALIYAALGDARAGWISLASCVGVLASAALWRGDAIAAARETLAATVFILLVVLSALGGGTVAPSVVWLAVCPMVSAAGGASARGQGWVAASAVAILLVYFCEGQGWLPASQVRDMHLLSVIGNIALILLVAVFLLLYERHNAHAITELNLAMQTIQRMATLDVLTGVKNRGELLRLAELERERAARHGVPMSFCMMDVDHFKSVNDTHGHGAGDAVLRQIACTVRSMVRATDHFGRYGGEEFLLISSATDGDGAAGFAERICEAVRTAVMPGLDGRVVTMSIGVAQHVPGQTVAQGLEAADRALYRAKRSGRDRVCVAGEMALAPL